MANTRVNREIFRSIIQAQLDRTVPFSFGRKFLGITTKRYWKPNFLSNNTVISVVPIFRNARTTSRDIRKILEVCSIRLSTRNFPNFWLSGKRPRCLASIILISGCFFFCFWKFLMLRKIRDGGHLEWHHMPPAPPQPIIWSSSKTFSKYCNTAKAPGGGDGLSTPSFLYHGKGVNLLVWPRLN